MFDYNGYFLFEDKKILYFDPKSENIEELDEKKSFKKTSYKGENIFLNTASNSRCPFHMDCMGCSYINQEYDTQFEIKKEQFDYIFRNQDVAKKYFSDNRTNYKNKIRLHVSLIDDNIVFNLNGNNPKLFFPCLIINSKINEFIKKFNEFKFETRLNDLFSFNEVFLTLFDGKIVISLKKNYNIYDKLLLKKIELLKYKNLILDDNNFQMNYSLETDKKYDLFYSSRSFVQSNSNINQEMVSYIYNNFKKIVGNSKFDLYDFFGGNGNLSIPQSSLFENIYVIESNVVAKENLIQGNIANNLNVKFLNLNLEKEFPNLSTCKKVAILDPPRVGIFDRQLKKILEDFDYVIYVSCSPKVIKRQLKIINKFQDILEASLFDNFAYTKHFESIVISKKK